MSKSKSLTAQIEKMQADSKRLEDYEKLFDKACQINLGYSAKKIKKILLELETETDENSSSVK